MLAMRGESGDGVYLWRGLGEKNLIVRAIGVLGAGGLSADKRAGELCLKLIEFTGTVAEPVIVGYVVKELLGVEGASQEESEIAVSGFNDVGDFVDGFSTVKYVLVSETVFDSVCEGYAVTECFSNTRE